MSKQPPENYGAGRSAAVLVASTSAAAGKNADTVGPMFAAWLRSLGYECPEPIVVADGEPVRTALDALLVDAEPGARPRVIITTGGTGLNPDDRTPDIVAGYLERETPGIMHALWSYGLEKTPTAVMSRGVAGVRGCTFLVTLPGSSGGAKDGVAVLEPILHHIQAQIEDVRDHDFHRPAATHHAVHSVAETFAPAVASSGSGSPADDDPADASSDTTPAADDSPAGDDPAVGTARVAPTPVPGTVAFVEASGVASETTMVGPDTAEEDEPASDFLAGLADESPAEAPVSDRVLFAEVTMAPLDPVVAEDAVTSDVMGAAVTFHGIIRNHDSGHDDVVGLTYTAHPDAGRILRATVEQVAEAHPGTLIWCGHRIGPLDVGDDALVVSVAAAHRGEAFACCAAVVDAIKAEVPIWKEQHYAAGDHDWVGLT